MLMVALMGAAKELKTLRITTEPVMVCNNCENKIKKNIRFEKGINKISTDLKKQVVTIVYDADKTDPNKIIEAFGKINYKAIVLEEGTKEVNNCAPDTESCGEQKCHKDK